MVNRAHIEFYQRYEDSEKEGLSALLYVEEEGQPARMGAAVERRMKAARAFMKDTGKLGEWRGESVASLLIVMAAIEDGYGAMPRFLCCVSWVAVEYLWRVYLGPQPGEYRIECFEVDNRGPRGFMDKVTKVNWQREERA
jgi:hypothetical protein